MNLSELFKIALRNGEDKGTLSRTLNPLRRSGTQYILQPRYGIRTYPSDEYRATGRRGIVEEDHDKWIQMRRDVSQGKIDVTVEDILEEYPDAYDRIRIREFGPKSEEFFMYLLETYYQPAQTVYERRDTYGGEYDI
jgi:hypothetical protein